MELSGRRGATGGIRPEEAEPAAPGSEAVRSMHDKIISLLRTEWPRRVLNIGSGAGDMDMKILDTVPASRIDCVEISPEMARASVSTLGRFLDRAEIIHKDVMKFNPAGMYDAIVSSLVLHGMTGERKAALLAKIREWLAPGGLFIWGDLTRQEVAGPGKGARAGKLAFALRRGRKTPEDAGACESWHDHPLTEGEMRSLAAAAGFKGVFLEWRRGSLAVFSMRA